MLYLHYRVQCVVQFNILFLLKKLLQKFNLNCFSCVSHHVIFGKTVIFKLNYHFLLNKYWLLHGAMVKNTTPEDFPGACASGKWNGPGITEGVVVLTIALGSSHYLFYNTPTDYLSSLYASRSFARFRYTEHNWLGSTWLKRRLGSARRSTVPRRNDALSHGRRF